jgi:hypothetical protein
MKTLITTSVLTALLICGVTAMAQNQTDDYLGLPGDNLNLFAVMKLFQESKTLEEFERNLNDENYRINNLDLNGDNKTDYINVFDNVHGNIHNIVLQVAVNKREKQDVAVFTVERDKNGNVMIQLTGDEALYGENYIVEPVIDEAVAAETPNPGYTGNATSVNGRDVVVVRTSYVEIASWPLITYIYDPGYVVWKSSWYWGYYPVYWNPWRPYYWHYYYGYHYNWYDNYYAHYRRWNHHRDDCWNDYYYHPHHAHSEYVAVNIREGHYKSTYSHPEERKKGEALYASTHRDSGNSTHRNESVRIADLNRRNISSSSAERSTGYGSAGSSGRYESSTSDRRIKDSQSADKVRSSAERSYSQVRSSEAKSHSETRSSGTSVSSQPRTIGNRSSSVARSTESKSRETGKTASPERRESKPKQEVKKESQSRSKNPEKESETKRR